MWYIFTVINVLFLIIFMVCYWLYELTNQVDSDSNDSDLYSWCDSLNSSQDTDYPDWGVHDFPLDTPCKFWDTTSN
jgi:hypothetical protein